MISFGFSFFKTPSTENATVMPIDADDQPINPFGKLRFKIPAKKAHVNPAIIPANKAMEMKNNVLLVLLPFTLPPQRSHSKG